uniref:Uncharacterized protein n=1 Tax=Chenopodium quinoa TaxID=63459 RepID=A0A803LCE2_CHEQI
MSFQIQFFSHIPLSLSTIFSEKILPSILSLFPTSLSCAAIREAEVKLFLSSVDIRGSSSFEALVLDTVCSPISLQSLSSATGDGAEHHDEAAAAMDTEIEGISTSETSSRGSNKRLKRDRLADAVSCFAESLAERKGH